MQGIHPDEVGELTFRQIDWIFQRNIDKKDSEWEQTRLIVAALTGKKPAEIIKLSREKTEGVEWTPEKARKIIRRYGWQA